MGWHSRIVRIIPNRVALNHISDTNYDERNDTINYVYGKTVVSNEVAKGLRDKKSPHYQKYILGLNGRCSECEEYTYPDSTGKTCSSDTCDSATQILKPNGRCEHCPSESHPAEDGRECVT